MEILLFSVLFITGYFLLGAIVLFVFEVVKNDYLGNATDMGISLVIWPALVFAVILVFVANSLNLFWKSLMKMYDNIINLFIWVLTLLGWTYIKITRKILKRKQ